MFVVVVSFNILRALLTNGERVLTEMCKVAALPLSIASFIERVCDDPVTQNDVGSPKIFIEDMINQLSSIIIQSCTSGKLQPSGSDSTFRHAQALRSTCLRLLMRFMPLPVEDSAVAPAHQPPIEVTMSTYVSNVPLFV